VLLVALAPDEEAPVPAPHRDADDARGKELAQPGGKRRTARPGRCLLGEELVLGLGPGDRPGILDVLEPAVRVGHAAAVELLDEVEPFRRWVAGARRRKLGSRHAAHLRWRPTVGGWLPGAPRCCGTAATWQDAEA
jgi:hypothetical protein